MKNRAYKRAGNAKRLKHDRKKNVLFLFIGIVGFLGIILISSHLWLNHDAHEDSSYDSYINSQVPSSSVCMAGDLLKKKAVLSVEIDDEVYYGCCEKCLNKLIANENNERYAIDPYSNKQVNKADSYIRLTEERSGKVEYFESESNFYDYAKKQRGMY